MTCNTIFKLPCYPDTGEEIRSGDLVIINDVTQNIFWRGRAGLVIRVVNPLRFDDNPLLSDKDHVFIHDEGPLIKQDEFVIKLFFPVPPRESPNSKICYWDARHITKIG